MCRAEEFSASESANDQPKVKDVNETNCAAQRYFYKLLELNDNAMVKNLKYVH